MAATIQGQGVGSRHLWPPTDTGCGGGGDLPLIPDNHARPTAPSARAALDYSVVDLGVFSAQCLGNRRPVLWSAKSYGVGQATRTVVLPRIGAQDPFQRFVQASYGFYPLAASLSAAAGVGRGQPVLTALPSPYGPTLLAL